MQIKRFVCVTMALLATGSLLTVAGCTSPEATDSVATENSVPAAASGQAQPGMQGAKLTVPHKSDKDGH